MNCKICGKSIENERYAIIKVIFAVSNWEQDWWKDEEKIGDEFYHEGCYQPQRREGDDRLDG